MGGTAGKWLTVMILTMLARLLERSCWRYAGGNRDEPEGEHNPLSLNKV